MEEIWKNVVGYEGFYQVSNLGRVMNPPTVWRWLNRVTKMPKEWQERGLKYYD